jgi:hypothetical protein
MVKMGIGGRSVLKRLVEFIRYWTFIRRGRPNLPCDSKSPALCYACHKLRDILTGSHVIGNGPVVVTTKHNDYLFYGDRRATVTTQHGGAENVFHVTTEYGTIPPNFLRDQ